MPRPKRRRFPDATKLLRRVARILARRWWTWQFRRCCSRSGSHLEVQGPCALQVEGLLEIGEDLVIRSRAHNRVDIFVGPAAELHLGDGVFLNQGVRIACCREIRIGDGCQIGDESVLLDTDYHAVGSSEVKAEPIILENGAWLATRVMVLRGVTIGEGSVIGAGSVVTHSIPPYSFAAGVPARILRSLRQELR